MTNYDIIIAGGGMVGATTALALAHLPLKIALIEAVEADSIASPSFDQRAVALSAASVNIYKSLGLWDKLQPLACPIKSIHVSDQGRMGFTRLYAKDYAVDALGQVIPLDETGPILWQQLQDKQNVTCYCPASISTLRQLDVDSNSPRVEVTLSTPQQEKTNHTKTINAQLLLAADGTFSSIAEKIGIETNRESYAQHAVIANIATELPHNLKAFERFTSQGPLALLPLTRQRLSLVWCQSDENLETTMAYNDAQFAQALQETFGYRLGKIVKVGQRFSYPLSLHIPEKTFSESVMLIGNSAHTLHPIAGQGFNIGLRDIAAFYDAVKQQLSAQEKNDECANKSGLANGIGHSDFLSSFELSRQDDWQKTIGVTDGLVRLFSQSFLPIVYARNKGLCLVDKIPFVKNKLAFSAMGLSGESASLTRGLLP